MKIDWCKLQSFVCFILPIFILTFQFAVQSHADDPPVTALAFSPDGNSLVACSQAGLQIYDWPELKRQKSIKSSAANLHCLAFSPDGKQLAVGGGNPADVGIVEIFSWPAGTVLMTLSGHDDSVTSVAWKGETNLVSASLDRAMILWDLATQKPSLTFQGHSRGISSVCILNDGTLVTAGYDHSVRVWNSESGKLIRSLNQHTKPIHALALRPGTEGLAMVASAAGDRTIRFWQPTIGRMTRFIRLESEPLNIAWINESLIVASCVDGQARIVDSNQVKVTRTIPAMKGWAYAVAVHSTDGSIVIGGAEGLFRLETATK